MLSQETKNKIRTGLFKNKRLIFKQNFEFTPAIDSKSEEQKPLQPEEPENRKVLNVKIPTRTKVKQALAVEPINDLKRINQEITAKTGIDVPLVRHGSIEKEDLSSLKEGFDKFWEQIEWDYYDVRKKEAYYALENDQKLQELDAITLNRLIRDYYEGINEMSYKPITDSLNKLKQDKEHRQNIELLLPDRKKATSKFIAKKGADGKWNFQRVSNKGIAQKVVEQDVRSVERLYPEIPDSIVNTQAFQNYLKEQVNIALSEEPEANEMEIEAWYMSTTARKNQPGSNAPEGYHQDGYQYIGNLVIRRDEEIEGGESVLYSRKPENGEMIEVNRTVLEEGQHLDQKDKDTDLWHDITPFTVKADAPRNEYRRDIIGSAVTILPKQEESTLETSHGKEQQIKQYQAIIATGDRHLITANKGHHPIKNYQLAKQKYQEALSLKNQFGLGKPKDFVKITDHQERKFALQTLTQAIAKIDSILTELQSTAA